jgi:16S rRNA processing protein RimM
MTSAEWVLLARIVRPQGRRGEVLAEIHPDFPDQFAQRKRLFLRPSDGSAMRETRVESHWLHKDRIVLKFFQVDSISEAETLRGCEVVVPREERIPLEGDAVYVSDLLGMHVIDISRDIAEVAGEIIDVEPEGAGPAMLVIRAADGEELLIPFVRAYLRKIDQAAGRLEMELPAGLLTTQRPD